MYTVYCMYYILYIVCATVHIIHYIYSHIFIYTVSEIKCAPVRRSRFGSDFSLYPDTRSQLVSVIQCIKHSQAANHKISKFYSILMH